MNAYFYASIGRKKIQEKIKQRIIFFAKNIKIIARKYKMQQIVLHTDLGLSKCKTTNSKIIVDKFKDTKSLLFFKIE